MDGTTTYMLISTSKVKKEAWEFMKWVTRPESMKMWAGVRILGRVPTTYVGFETPELVETYPDLVGLHKKGVLLKGALIMPSFPGWLEMVKVLGHGIQEALLGIKSPQQALNDAQAECQEILEEE
jgi:multiple sugar transport system substrate-binding protein